MEHHSTIMAPTVYIYMDGVLRRSQFSVGKEHVMYDECGSVQPTSTGDVKQGARCSDTLVTRVTMGESQSSMPV